MALTAVAPTRNSVNATTGLSSGSLQIPRDIAVVAITTADALGVALTQSSDSVQQPAALVTFTGDADWFWSATDGLTTANMRKIPAMFPYQVQCTPGKTQNFYMKTATAANISVCIEG